LKFPTAARVPRHRWRYNSKTKMRYSALGILRNPSRSDQPACRVFEVMFPSKQRDCSDAWQCDRYNRGIVVIQ
jgi:hypothetical protein